MSVPAEVIANYFLAAPDLEAGEGVSNLKLQKLCYYAQGLHLAVFDVPLFPESIEAWAHGPGVPSLYHKFKGHGAYPIPAPDELDLSGLSADSQDLLGEVWEAYGQFSAWKLRDMSHETPPWKDCAAGAVITTSAMKAYFKQLVD